MDAANSTPLRGGRLMLLGGILLAGGIARFYGISFGLDRWEGGPAVYPLSRPDEQFLWVPAFEFFGGDLNPHKFVYPSFYLYLLALVYCGHLAFQLLFFHGASWSSIAASLSADPAHLILIDRGLSACLGTLTIAVTYRIAAKAFGRDVGLLSALGLAATYLHIRESHFGVTDTAATFLICVSFLAIMRVAASGNGRLRDSALAAALVGLAISTKYVAAVLIAPLLFAHLLGGPARARAWRGIPVALLLVGVGFIAGTPYALLSPREFLAGIDIQFSHQGRPGWLGVNLGRGWLRHAAFTLWYGLGWPQLIAALAGLGLAFKRDVRWALLLVSFVIPFYLSVGSGYLVFVRYVLPIVPFLCIAAAITIFWACGSIVTRHRVATAYAAAALMLVPSVQRAIAFDRFLPLRDSRSIAAEWIESTAGPQDRLLLVGSPYSDVAIALRGKKAYQSHDWPPRFMERPVGPAGYRHHRVHARPATRDPDQLALGRPDLVIAVHGPLPAYSVPDPVIERLSEKYELVRLIEGVGTHPEMRFDLQDAFYVPFAGIEHAVRPGPNVYLFRGAALPEP